MSLPLPIEVRPFIERTALHRLTAAAVAVSTILALAFPPGIIALAFVLTAGGAFAILIALEFRQPLLNTKWILGLAACLILAAVALPPRFSMDIWSYAIYGRILAHYHANPYALSPMHFSQDPLFKFVSHYWLNARSVYGPVFTGLSAAGMTLAGSSPLLARLLFQGLAALSVGAVLILLEKQKVDSRVLICLGLNPFVVLSVINGGHNDALCGLGVLAGFLFAMRGRSVACAATFSFCALIKLTMFLPAFAMCLWIWRNRSHKQAISLAATTLAMTGLGYAAAGGEFLLRPLRSAAKLVSYLSLWNVGKRWRGLWLMRRYSSLLRHSAPNLGAIVAVAVALLFVGATINAPSPAFAAGGAVLVYVLVAAYIEPWYIMWVLPLLALNFRSKLALGTMAYSMVLLIAGIPVLYFKHGGILLHRLVLDALPAIQIIGIVTVVILAGRKLLLEHQESLSLN